MPQNVVKENICKSIHINLKVVIGAIFTSRVIGSYVNKQGRLDKKTVRCNKMD